MTPHEVLKSFMQVEMRAMAEIDKRGEHDGYISRRDATSFDRHAQRFDLLCDVDRALRRALDVHPAA